MNKTAILFATGFEEVEALTVVDLLRRAGITCDIISLDGSSSVTGSHGITVITEKSFDETDFSAYDGIILPGGKKGTENLGSDERVLTLLRDFAGAGKLTAAICAAPTVLAKAGILEGKRAVCYPGMEEQLTGAATGEKATQAGGTVITGGGLGAVVVDGTVITGTDLGAAMDFALVLVEYFEGANCASVVARAIDYR